MVWDVYSDDLFEAIVVGGGPCSLAVAARLCENTPGSIFTEDEHQRFHWLKQRGNKVGLVSKSRSMSKNGVERRYTLSRKFSPQEILVLDAKSDKFLGQWDSQFAACQIPYLRSPMFFHPDPANIDGMVSFAHLTRRESDKDLKKIDNVVGREYSKHQLKKLAAKNSRKHKPLPNNGGGSHHNVPGLIDINMRDWKDYYRPSTGLFRDFCESIIRNYGLEKVVRQDEVVKVDYGTVHVIDKNVSGEGFEIETLSGKKYYCKVCVVASGHRGKINYPIAPFENGTEFPHGSCHVSHVFNEEVEFPTEKIREKISIKQGSSIVIVGGGLTSAQLAHNAVKAGVSKVYLVFRGPVKIKHFDFHLDWVTKYKNVKKSAFYMLDTDEERYEMIQEAREGGSINPSAYKFICQDEKNGKLELLKFLTISEQEWDQESGTWNLVVKLKVITNNHDTELDSYKEVSLRNIDYIYFATGVTADVESLPFLRPIVEKHSIDFVKGLPCLTDNLQWNETLPMFMIGKNASLKMGPSSANLDGARLGAERIGWYIQEQRAAGKFSWFLKCICCQSDEDLELQGGSSALEKKLDASSIDSNSELEEEATSYQTRLKLAAGELNWFSLLSED